MEEVRVVKSCCDCNNKNCCDCNTKNCCKCDIKNCCDSGKKILSEFGDKIKNYYQTACVSKCRKLTKKEKGGVSGKNYYNY